ncbi:hypothetical protein RGUI_3911 [Rhodovulum sp. P5]|nr:hypothetical protein RGUI_3911 [Rhodovulum sp. P5]
MAFTLAAGYASATTVYYGEGAGNDPFPEPLLGAEALAKCDQGGGSGTCIAWEDAPEAQGGAEGDYSAAFSVVYSGNQSFGWSFDSSLVTGASNVLLPTIIAVKAANKYQIFEITGGDVSGTIDISGYQRNDISHVSFYNIAAVPLPAAGWMLIGGLGGLAAMQRRKTG